ncbi:protein pangolin, isoforms A/H/I/S-like isoform X2 [Tachypleus tridentatus]|uniref:protein pangolin, isoforms A/H/I/S-like isoform X2 n=1 Tax=Tachypleus tridentatus TaxID=6853 RepID=UPI003FD12E46
MPHVGSGGGDDLASSDEIKVFKDEGEEENRSSENLTDLKSSLVTEGEEDKSNQLPGQSFSTSKSAHSSRADTGSTSAKVFDPIPHAAPIGYVVSPYPHPNGTLGPPAMAGKVAMVPPSHPGSPLPFMMYNSDAFAQPPPAHMGIPPVHIDPKTGIPRPPVYPLPTPGQYPHPVFSPEFTQQFQWHTPTMYPMTSTGFCGPYPATLPVTSGALPRFSPPTLLPPPPGLTPHPGLLHPALMSAGRKQELQSPVMENSRHLSGYLMDQKPQTIRENETNGPTPHSSSSVSSQQTHHIDKKKAPHIKKPLNAFMLYMKEMRDKVVAECTLKESAAINQILGRRWHSLSRDEQSKYYEMARKERQLHMQLYPGWTARDNYALSNKKKKKKKDKSTDGVNNPKKCRARFGLDQQSSWCKPCRRKKKCIRYLEGADNGESEDNLGSIGSVDAPTPDSKSADESDLEGNSMNTSELSLSSPPVPNDNDVKQEVSENGVLSNFPHPSCSTLGPQRTSHPFSIQHLTAPHSSSVVSRKNCDSESSNIPIPQLPTPPSTDSSTATVPQLLTVT